jgi:hypothetical protein
MTEAALTDAWDVWRQQISAYLDEHGFLPTLGTEGIDIPFDVAADCWMVADPSELPSLCRLTDAMGAAPARAAVLLFLAHLSDDEPYLRLPEPEESERRATVRKLFSDGIALLPVDQLDTAWWIRWELPFAAKAERWDRVDALVRQWTVLAPGEERDALTAFARINLLSVHPARSSDFVDDWWSPYEGSQYADIGDIFASLYAARLDNRARLDSAEWQLPRTMPAEDFGRVLDAEHAITKVQDATNALSPTLRLISAWCSAVVGVRLANPERIRDAARRYAALVRERNLPEPLLGSDDKMLRFPAWSAATLFRAAGDLDSARDMAVVWTEADKDSPDAWRFRAEIERALGLDSWPESYERYIQLSPDTDTSWEHSELLRLLLESRDTNAADRALRALALEHADRSAVQEMLLWDWAAYQKLHETTRERWWDGLVFVCDARVRSAFRRAPWRYAAACFGEAIALELRVRVFGPLAMTQGFERQAMSDREARIANAILGSKATLGTMIEALTLATDARSELGQLINRFLGQRHRPLRSHLQSKPAVARLKAATESRNEAVHGDITPDEAKQVYAEARAFLDMLVKEDPRILDR